MALPVPFWVAALGQMAQPVGAGAVPPDLGAAESQAGSAVALLAAARAASPGLGAAARPVGAAAALWAWADW